MKQHSLHHSISICEVKLKILMETHELLGRLPVWRNKLCGPCFLLCCACFSPFFQLLSMTVHQYDKWLCKAVHDLCWFDPYRQNNQLIVNFILCQGNYAMETRDVNTHLCGSQILFSNLLVFFLIDSSILKSVDFLFHYKTSV